ncbi:MAG: hypothetical protein GX029_06045 [Pseudomonadaceae bacterium]|nr:hypothetical protein [Pseudomonadaceae bacterium]
MPYLLVKLIFGLKKQRLFIGTACLLCLLLTSGCTSVNLEKFLKPVNVDKLSSYELSHLNCSIQSGLQSERDFAVLASGIVSFGFRLPTSADQDFNYDRRLDDYNDCLRISGL